jgi:hypothetical protein
MINLSTAKPPQIRTIGPPGSTPGWRPNLDRFGNAQLGRDIR